MRPHSVSSLLDAAQQALDRNDRRQARRLVARAIEIDASSLRALLMYVSLAKTSAAALTAAQQACEVAPDDRRAQSALRWTEQRVQEAQRSKNVPLAPTSSHVLRWRSVRVVASALILLVVLSVATIAGLTYWQQQTAEAAPDPLQTALARAEVARGLGDHEAAIRFLSEAHGLAPGDDGVAYYLAQEHVARSTQLLKAGDPDAALPHLKAAYDLRPEEEPIVREYQALLAYVAGREAHANQNWDRVMEALLPLYQLDRDYLDTETLLGDALLAQRQTERELRANGRRALRQMRDAQPGRLARAVLEPEPPSSRPGQTSADMGLPPLEPVSNKRIVIDISEQRTYVYENGDLKWSWISSTGERAKPTIPGKYRVQSKIENARSNVWQLWMPWWLGIYWVGSVENGIHGLPTNDNGYQMWAGYLGQRVSYGCIVLSVENARRLWQWAEIGTPVTVRF